MTINTPAWYAQSYPTIDDLESFACDLGAVVVWGRCSWASFFPGDAELAPAIFVPRAAHALARVWGLSHEIGHLVQHSGPRGELMWAKGEAQANRWAACALIPQERIRAHKNASLDAMVAALSAHFEDIPLEDCPARRLAAKIARIRLRALDDDPISGQISKCTA